ncbi:MAG TPA: thioredoxin family protein [Bacteroidia bacterium]|nr:thioredoxin family protein [Bacteroidia bacterium]
MNKRSFLLALSALALGSFAAMPVRAADDLKIIKFEAEWCGPCKKMAPIFSAVAKESKGVAFQTVDVDKQSAVADRYHVEMLPTVVAVKNGREVGRLSGFQNAAKLKAFVKKHS